MFVKLLSKPLFIIHFIYSYTAPDKNLEVNRQTNHGVMSTKQDSRTSPTPGASKRQSRTFDRDELCEQMFCLK